MSQTKLESPILDDHFDQSGAALVDRFGRRFNYLRVAIIEHCNLRCIYCMPEEGIAFAPTADLLTTAELLRMVRISARAGVSKVRFTGGEPLLHPDILTLVSGASGTAGISSVNITTNGIMLPGLARELKVAGLQGVVSNLSLIGGGLLIGSVVIFLVTKSAKVAIGTAVIGALLFAVKIIGGLLG